MLSSIRLAFALSAAATLVLGCSNPGDDRSALEPEAGIVTVYTVNYPLKYFADRIGGEHVDVVFPAPHGEDPAFWTPDVETISAYQQADLILLNGADYAKWIPKVTLPQSRLVDTTAELKSRYIILPSAVSHSHGPGAEHTHEGVAFTTWLDPEFAIAQSNAIHLGLAELRPAHKESFQRNYDGLKTELEALDRKFRHATSTASQYPVVFSHPVFQYLERKYELDGKTVHWEPDVFPSDDAWEELTDLLQSHPAKWMIWEGKPLDESVKQLLELDVRSIVFDPCGNVPDDGDWLQVMQRNAEAVKLVGAVPSSE